MARNLLLTGPPRSGKTTVVERTVDQLPADLTVGGLTSPERRSDGERVGFALVDRRTGESRLLASVDREEGPTVGSYRVDPSAVEEFAPGVLERARTRADVVVIDEIGPMQLLGDAFVRETLRTLAAPVPVLATLVSRPVDPVVEEIRQREDTRVVTVDEDSRERLPSALGDRLVATHDRLGGRRSRSDG